MNLSASIRRKLLFGALSILVVGLFVCDLTSGAVGIGVQDVWNLMTGAPCEPLTRDIILKIRLVKALVALLAGIALAASGLLMQTLFRNPLAGPFVLGISSGASLGVALFLLGAPLLGVAAHSLLLGIGTIARMLNERDIPSPGRYRFEHGIITNNNKKGSALLWNRHALSDILRNIAYIGHLAQGKCTASLIRGIPVHRTPESEWDIVYNTHEPIVSQELFDRVQGVNEANAKAYKAAYGTCSHLPTRSNPYRAKLLCADCGTQLKLYRCISRDRKKAYFVYICPTYEEHRELRCTKKSIRCDDLDAAVLQALRVQIELFCDTQAVLMKLAEKRASGYAHDTQAKSEIHRIQQEIKRKQGYALALYEDYKSGLLTKEECVMAREQYQKEIEALKAQVERLECLEDGAAQAIEKSKEWEKRFEEYRHAEVISQELISAFVDRIQVWADGSIKITFLFDNELKGLRAQYKSLREEVA